MSQQMYGGAETNVAPVQATTPTRGGAVGHFRGRGMQNVGLRGVRGGGFAGRGRGMLSAISSLDLTSPIPGLYRYSCQTRITITSKCADGPSE